MNVLKASLIAVSLVLLSGCFKPALAQDLPKAANSQTAVQTLGASENAAEKTAPRKKREKSYLRVPVFFLTDRNLVKDKVGSIDFGPHRKYIGECKHDPYVGVVTCVVENEDDKDIDGKRTDLGWKLADASEQDKIDVRLQDGQDWQEIQKQFYGSMKDAAKRTEDGNLLLFAHGYKNTFRSALHTAARFAYFSERPVMLYSWPSVATLKSYTSDENNVEWSQEHFNDMIAMLGKVCDEDPAVKVRIYVHSMGSRLLVRSIPSTRANRDKTFIAEGALICPDIDSGLVQHYIRKYINPDGTVTIRLYMSQRDKALAISQLIHGGYSRLGECADSLSDMIAQVIPGMKKDEEEIDDGLATERLASLRKRTHTIDFTDIDEGVIGHKIPARLICNMSLHNEPGAEYELHPQQSGERSGLERFFKRKFQLNDGSHISGDCLRVVKVDKSETGHSASPVASTDSRDTSH